MSDKKVATKYLAWGPSTAKHGLVFLHGWTMNGKSMKSSLQELLGGVPLPDTIIYCLTAPHCRDEDGETPQWFAYNSDSTLNFSRQDVINSRARITSIVQRLRVRHKRRNGTLSLGGYSQGACMALDVALMMQKPMKLILYAGFAMLPRFVTSLDGWHGYPPLPPLPLGSRAARKRRLSLWVYHGRQDTEITWSLARRSYEALRELRPTSVRLERLEVSDEDDHWSMWSSGNVQAANLLRAAMGLEEHDEACGDGEGDEEEEEEQEEVEEEERPPCNWNWNDLSDEQRADAAELGYDEDSWWHDEERRVPWDTIMAEERTQKAALALGFTRGTWPIGEAVVATNGGLNRAAARGSPCGEHDQHAGGRGALLDVGNRVLDNLATRLQGTSV